MGKLTTFEILVDNQEGVVKAGDTLRGQVLLELHEDMEVKEIRVSFCGRARIHWSQAQKSQPGAEIQSAGALESVSAEEIYCNDSLKLFPSAENATESTERRRNSKACVKLPKGPHTYDFQFAVPDSAPSSFSGAHGSVRYLLRAVVERPWRVEANARCITVQSHLDLNDVPGAKEGAYLMDSIKVNSLFFNTGECQATMNFSRTGFTNGEVIPVNFSIHNNSHQEMHNGSLHLKMIVTYKAKNKKCTLMLPLAKVNLGKIPAQTTLEGVNRNLRVPLTCQPTGLPGCSLMNIKYQLELKIKPALLTSKRLKLQTPIIVGTKALDTSYADSPPDYWSCCPPSYEEVMALSPLNFKKSIFNLSFTKAPPIYSLPSKPLKDCHLNRENFQSCPDLTSDEPRLTVFRQISQEESDVSHPLLRPRANTGPTEDLLRTRGC